MGSIEDNLRTRTDGGVELDQVISTSNDSAGDTPHLKSQLARGDGQMNNDDIGVISDDNIPINTIHSPMSLSSGVERKNNNIVLTKLQRMA